MKNLFDYIGTGDKRREREIEQALTDHMKILATLSQNLMMKHSNSFEYTKNAMWAIY
ncbi:MAG: hypothetical protein LBL96_12470 [Clostridiales bacterium]|jgi:hypothetical protein|nr:hypothetical protein [Clostridiales bacterium]